MQAICTTSGKPFTISAAEAQYCRDHNLPLPKIHPHERLKKILSFRNRTFLYNATCAFSHKPILSQIPPERGFTIFDNDIWNSDQWDPLAYGQSYDPSRPFFEQFAELLKKVPLPNLTIVRSSTVNSEYVNGAANLKNCYLTFASTFLEDCMFCWNSFECKNIVDCISAAKSELCYDCRSIENCYRVQHADSCSNCSDSYFLENCKSCKNCYGCVNLNNKEYCWFNEQLTQSDFNKRIAELELGSYEVRKAEKAKFATFKKTLPRKYLEGTNNESCTGNYIHNCKDCRDVFHSTGAVDVETSIAANKCKDTFSVAYCISSELTYNTHAGIGHYNIQFCGECIQLKDSMYCLYCIQGCSDCFGCVGLKKKQYCILNKQYSKEEYEKLVAKIKQDLTSQNAWQEYFPPAISPIYYNQSDGMIIFPLTKEEALKRGFAWKDEEPETNQPVSIPDTIAEVADNILQTTLTCEQTRKKYRIVKPELAFYRQMNIPLPHIAPLERVHNLASIFAIKEVQTIKCSTCQQQIFSVYDQAERPILCEECYLKTL